MEDFLNSASIMDLVNLHLPRYGELPGLDLYMDQVISVTDQVLSPLFSQSSRPILTPTMINNYVRRKLVPAPVKKKYTRNHLAYFIVVALLKPVFSIGEIDALIRRQIEVAGTDAAYDRICQELEQCLQTMFAGGEPMKPLPPTGEADLVRAVVVSLTNKIYVEKVLEYSGLLKDTEKN